MSDRKLPPGGGFVLCLPVSLAMWVAFFMWVM
jgi:hypothetical protein